MPSPARSSSRSRLGRLLGSRYPTAALEPYVFVNAITRRTLLLEAENLAAVRLSADNDLSKHSADDLRCGFATRSRVGGFVPVVWLIEKVQVKARNGDIAGLRLDSLADDSVRQTGAIALPREYSYESPNPG